MDIQELAVWAIMTGGLLTLIVLALADAAVHRSLGSLRNVLFVVITSTACVITTGLPDVLWPNFSDRIQMLLKVGFGPLGGALALHYLGLWLGGIREDVVVHRITTWGGLSLFFTSVTLSTMVLQVPESGFRDLLIITFGVNFIAAVLGVIACVRASLLGDPLARWMTLVCLQLVALVIGLYLRALDVPGFGLGTWILTAAATLGYFMGVAVLVGIRSRETRKLARLANLQKGADPATELSTGSVLISDINHAFWRTARFQGECTVVCINLHNLYELAEKAGHGIEQQILATMAARIRRAAGFRCVVGLYHPRCFVVVISADRRREFVNQTLTRLRATVTRPMVVVARDQNRHEYVPNLGIGIITVDPRHADALMVVTEAERQALAKVRAGGAGPEDTQDNIVTAPAPLPT